MPAPANSLSAKLHTGQCCDQDDIRRLRILLSPEKPTRPVGPAHTRKNSAISDSRSSRAPSTISRAASKTSYTASTHTTLARPPPRSAKSESELGPLLPQERHHLAIEAVNGCLRVLSAATPSASVTQASNGTAKPYADSNGARHRAKTASVSRTKTSDGSYSPTELTKEQILATAEVGCIAFDYLQGPEARRVASSPEAQSGLQNGLVAFVSKLLSHGLHDLALRHLRILKKVLLHSCSPAEPDQQALRRSSSDQTAAGSLDERDTLAGLLRLDITSGLDNAAFLTAVVNYQLLTLRLAAVAPRATIFNASLQYIEPSYDCSPVTNLVRLYELKPSDQHTLVQLESLALTIWESAKKLAAADNQDSSRASLVLKMIALALRIRLIWFGLCDHEYNFEKEIAAAFTKAVAKYSRVDANDPMQKYKLARRLYHEIIQQASDSCVSSRTQPVPNELMVLLSRMAQDAGLYNEAHDLSKALTEHSEMNGRVAAAEFVETARLATFAMSNHEHSEWHHIETAAHILNNGISDESPALALVMQEARKLRDAAYLYIRKALVLWMKKKDEQLQKRIVGAYRILTSFMMLLTRILSSDDEYSNLKEKRILAALRVSKPCLDAICNVTKKLIPLGWAPPEALLQGIALGKHLLDYLEQDDGSLVEGFISKDEINALRAEMSRSTWFLAADQSAPTTLALQSLKLGLSILQQAVPAVQKDGEEALGHYRLARVLQKLDRPKDAKSSFENAVNSCLKTGIVSDGARKANEMTITSTIKSDSNLRVLQATLRALFELHLSQADGDNFDIFTKGLDSQEEVAFLYEIWLTVLSGSIMPRQASFKTFDAVNRVAQCLLQIYGRSSFPLRRCRLLSKLLRLRAERPELASLVALTDVEETLSFSGLLANDEGLSSFWDHHVSSLGTAYGLLRGAQGVRQIANALETWTNLIKGSSSWGDVESRIDEPEVFMAQLNAIASFMDTQGLDEHRAQALALLASAEALSNDGALIRKTPRTIDVAAHLSQLGYTNEAGRYLDVGNILMGISGGANLQADLVRGLWLIARNESEKAAEILDAIREKVTTKSETALTTFEMPVGLPTKYRQIVVFSDILFTHAEWSLQTKGCGEAILFSKRAVSLLDFIWKSLEAKQRQDSSSRSPAVGDLEALAAQMCGLFVSQPSTLQPVEEDNTETRGPLFWPIAGRLFRALLQLSNISKLFGAQQAAQSAADQAYKVAKAVRSRPFIARSLLELGDIAWRRGDLVEANELLDSARSLYSKFPRPTWEHMALQCSYGNLFRSQSDLIREENAYERALGTLNLIKDPAWLLEIQELPPLSVPAEHDTDSSFGALSDTEIVETSSPAKSAKQWIEQQQNKIKMDVGRLTPTPISRQPLVGYEIFSDPFTLQRNQINFQKADIMLLSEQLSGCEQLLTSLAIGEGPAEYRARQNALQALLRLHEAIAELSTHAVFSMLPESTLALPAIPLINHDHNLSETDQQSSPVKIKEVIAGHVRSGSKATSISQLASVQTLQKTIASVSKLTSTTLFLCSNPSISRLQEVLTSASMLLAAAAQRQAPQYPALLAYNLDVTKSFSAVRSQAILDAELAVRNMADQFEFPDAVHALKPIRESTTRAPEFDLSNSLPSSWTVISFNLREDDGYLFITKYCADRPPFILRLPLQRSSGDELEDEESFSFADAREEIRNIIKASDDAVHLARDNPEALRMKGSKTRWWEEREALDARLGNLLTNIETLWFGGFKGIFAQPVRQANAVSRFRESFEGSLTKHLPSRQLQAKRQKTTTVKLDDNILELFLGLVMLQEDESVGELDEALNDLLYFVVDILQFNGESNAYDEIDFDAMIVEMQEALEDYRHHLLAASIRNPTSDHLILVLDKKLHAIPWESMPCLSNRSVSRLPSLIELRDRILFMHSQKGSNGDGIRISPSHGTYFLNPGSDLPSTQTKFERPLYNLATSLHWNKLVNAPPSEEMFAQALTRGIESSPTSSTSTSTSGSSSEKTATALPSILLYIGHGGGTQYIRQRTIQRLRSSTPSASTPSAQPSPSSQTRTTCNLPLLFGCSSASLTEAGEFEAHGIPRSYLLAGAPGLLGSLWDVTDGDLDKFAVATLEGWGLLEPGTCAAADKSRDKGKESARGKLSRQEQKLGSKGEEEDEHDDGGVGNGRRDKSLSSVVARARKCCYLRYLNGAAMVVYGVPLYLDTDSA